MSRETIVDRVSLPADAASRLVHDYETGIGLAPTAPQPIPHPGAVLAATLPVWGLAAGSVQALVTAANRIRAVRGLAQSTQLPDPASVGASFASDRLYRCAGAPATAFDELSGFFPTFDGWVRTHTNYPRHRRNLLAALDLAADAPTEAVLAQIAVSRAADLERRAVEHDALVVRVRTEEEWAQSPHGRAAGSGPLTAVDRRNDRGAPGLPTTGTSTQPLRGIRVLDLTRVIAGPVATRALALLGAEVLRIDPPQLPEIAWQFADTCQGKRSTLLNLRTQLPLFDELLAAADVLVTGYRPDALPQAGLTITPRPGLIHARVSAWGERGPWRERRGFDSIVQAASGISIIEGAPAVPGKLPAQALDHGSGYLLAAGIVDALGARSIDGVGRDVRVSLARTASWLLNCPGREPRHPPAAAPDPTMTAVHGEIVTARPALAQYDEYPWPAPTYGADRPAWRLHA